MTFTPLAAKCVLRLGLSGTVCEFGNQRYTAQKVDPGPSSTKEFYEKYWYKYTALDVNERMGATVADLNGPVKLGPFDLITNNGTGEHIFNQYWVFRNAHDLCKHEGVMLHILPFQKWVNHGFYNFNPILFRDLARANGYEILISEIANRWGKAFPLEDWAYMEKRPKELESKTKELLQEGWDVFCVFAFKKLKNEEFVIPIQGKYGKDVEGELPHTEHP